MSFLPVTENQSLHRDPRDPRCGRDAGRHLALFARWQKNSSLYGCSTFANFTVLPEIAVAKIRDDTPFEKVCYIGCGVTTGIGAVINTAKVEPGAKAIVFGLGGIGLNVIQGLRLVGADMIIGVDLNNSKKEWGERFGMTHFVNPKDVGVELVPCLVNLTKTKADQIGGADYTFDCTGNVTVMRQALEACHRGWGQSIIIGVAPTGAEIARSTSCMRASRSAVSSLSECFQLVMPEPQRLQLTNFDPSWPNFRPAF
jgi:Zn-dependent alcohol dehydrogenase